MKRYAIFEMTASGNGGWDLKGIVSKYPPSTNKQEMERTCSLMNKYKSNSWYDFSVYEVNDKNEPMCHGEIIK